MLRWLDGQLDFRCVACAAVVIPFPWIYLNREPVVTTSSSSSSTSLRQADRDLLDVLRREGALRITDLGEALGVTANAVRTRLNRLMEAGLVERQSFRPNTVDGRGRPFHAYRLSEAGRRRTGSNFSDLAVALWEEVRAIRDPEIRQGLFQRLTHRLAGWYSSEIDGNSPMERMQSVVQLLDCRDVPFMVKKNENDLPVLTALGCPYNELAEQDRSICSLEKMLFSELVGHPLKLGQCRLDGANCCTFEMN